MEKQTQKLQQTSIQLQFYIYILFCMVMQQVMLLTSQHQGPRFVLALGLWSVWSDACSPCVAMGFLWVLWAPSTSQNPADWYMYIPKLPISVKRVWVCAHLVPWIGWAFHPGCFPGSRPVLLGSTAPHTRITWLLNAEWLSRVLWLVQLTCLRNAVKAGGWDLAERLWETPKVCRNADEWLWRFEFIQPLEH